MRLVSLVALLSLCSVVSGIFSIVAVSLDVATLKTSVSSRALMFEPQLFCLILNLSLWCSGATDANGFLGCNVVSCTDSKKLEFTD